MRLVATHALTLRGLCACVCVSVTTVSPAKTAEPIQMAFEVLIHKREEQIGGTRRLVANIARLCSTASAMRLSTCIRLQLALRT